jgi:hypothetical protein
MVARILQVGGVAGSFLICAHTLNKLADRLGPGALLPSVRSTMNLP